LKKIWLTGFLCFIINLNAAALAAPTMNGETGLITDPTADVMQAGQFAAGYYHLQGGGVGTFTMNVLPKVEMGMAGFRFDQSAGNKTYVNAKWGILSESVLTPGVAVGVEDISDVSMRSAYAVASKTLPFGFRLHAGIGNGRFHGGFAGIEKTINPAGILTGNNAFPATTLIAEYDGRSMNYGVRLSVIPGLKLDAGWQNHSRYVGISFTN
jgi:hypothetical protein